MRVRIMMHYAGSFFIACLFIVIINIFYMRSYVYKEADLYHFTPSTTLTQIDQGILHEEGHTFSLTPELAEYLDQTTVGLQLLSPQFKEVLRYNVPINTATVYSPNTIIELYENDAVTTFVETISIGETSYTALLFYHPDQVKRTLYTSDTKKVSAAYNMYWLLGMNVMVLLMISYIYTYSISRPIHRITNRIVLLSEGDYQTKEPGRGIYAVVEKAMNQLSIQLAASRKASEEADAMREEWISNLSHDIKTPLTSMIGYGELLGEACDDMSEEERQHYKEVIVKKGTYIETLLADLNLTTRLKHSDHFLQCETVNLIQEIKSDLIDVLNSPHLLNPDHTVAFTHTHDIVSVKLDKPLFKRALLNLIYNSFVHNEAPVSVNVHVDNRNEHWVTIHIDDNGVGVSDQELDHIFTRYYRGTHTQVKSEGSGLGMAIAKDIVEAHEGRIKAEKSPLGGLKITIHLRRIPSNETLS
ncbi:MAG: sensor histidine kinase [Bacillota bacterium]